MKLIWLLLQESWVSVTLAVLTGLVSGSCAARLIVLINIAISGNSTTNLPWFFAGFVGITLLTGTISQFLLINIAQDAVYKLRIGLSQKILSAPLRQLEELGASRLLATLTGDVQTIYNSVFIIPFICIDIGIVTVCFIYLAWLSGTIFLFTFIFSGLAIATVQILLNKTLKILALAREEDDQLYKHFRTITEGIKELKLNNLRRQKFLSENLQVTASRSRNLRTKALKTIALASSGGQIFFFTILGLVIFGLPHIIPITPSMLTTYVITIMYLIVPIQNLMDRLPTLLNANVALQKVEQMGLTLVGQAETAIIEQAAQHQNWTSLELIQVTHTYQGEQEDSRFILGELNLAFYPGQLIFIIGGNGSGKSTLAKLIIGLYIPETGKIRLNNILITDQNREWYRQYFSVVFSDFYLFNPIVGIDSHDVDTQAEQYLCQLHLDHKVKVNNGKLSTTALSQGQRKRLALLAAYLEDRPIYLFDEWASDQDPFFRDIFYEQLLPSLRKRKKTVIVISHDEHYFHVADRVIKLDYGKIEYDRFK